MLFDFHVQQLRSMTKAGQLIRLEAAQDRERAVFADQAIMQKQAADRRVEIIGDGVAVQIDYKDAATCDPAHLAQKIYYPFVSEMMSEQRTDRIIEFGLAER